MKPPIGKEYLDFLYISPLVPEKKVYFNYDVILYHGAYECAGIIKHRQNVVSGLKRRLKREGYAVCVKPWSRYDRIGVEVQGNVIFVCKASNLFYDGNGKDYCANLAFEAAVEVLQRVELYHYIKYFTEKCPHDFFSKSFGN